MSQTRFDDSLKLLRLRLNFVLTHLHLHIFHLCKAKKNMFIYVISSNNSLARKILFSQGIILCQHQNRINIDNVETGKLIFWRKKNTKSGITLPHGTHFLRINNLRSQYGIFLTLLDILI